MLCQVSEPALLECHVGYTAVGESLGEGVFTALHRVVRQALLS